MGPLLAEIITRMEVWAGADRLRAGTSPGSYSSLPIAARKPKHQNEKSSWELNEAAIGGELTG